MSKNSDLVAIGTLAEGTAVEYEYGEMNLSTLQISFRTIKGYVGPRHTNRGGREKVVLMKTKTTGKRIGTVDVSTAVKLR